MYGFAQLIYPAFTFTHALVFGSIISSTDPVSVLGMLPPSTDRNLYMLIFGESALNDAVSIILYRFFSDLAADEDGKGITVGKFFLSFGYSIWIFVGSSCIGIFIGMLFAKMTKHVKPPESLPIFQLLMFLVFAYSSYLIADILEFTGIIAVFFCGAAMAHYSYNNLSKVTILSAKVCCDFKITGSCLQEIFVGRVTYILQYVRCLCFLVSWTWAAGVWKRADYVQCRIYCRCICTSILVLSNF